jgi:hypothetical protein
MCSTTTLPRITIEQQSGSSRRLFLLPGCIRAEERILRHGIRAEPASLRDPSLYLVLTVADRTAAHTTM